MAANPAYDIAYPGAPAGDAAILASRTGSGPLQVNAVHFLVVALGAPAPYADINQLLIDWLALSCLTAENALALGSAHFITRAARVSTWISDCVTVGGLKTGIRPGVTHDARCVALLSDMADATAKLSAAQRELLQADIIYFAARLYQTSMRILRSIAVAARMHSVVPNMLGNGWEIIACTYRTGRTGSGRLWYAPRPT